MIIEILFWILFLILFYTYVGYALVLWCLVKLKKVFSPKDVAIFSEKYKPDENSFQLNYPEEKIQYLWITDGSDDGTPELLRKYDNLEVHHLDERSGKMHAMNRGMKFVKAPVVIFSDTNTLLGKDSINEIVLKFSNPKVGCVAGEKRIIEEDADRAASAGEGLYWKMESWIKKMDAELNSAVGAVGELFAVKTELFEDVEIDTLLDDFIISLRIALKGYQIAYTPNAYAEETASLNIKEELKRKIRIAAGGMQTIFRLKTLLNPFKSGILSWQYFSHKVLRWTIAPLSLFILGFLNILLVIQPGQWEFGFYSLFLSVQVLCYLLAFVGWYFENKKLRIKVLFVPYYFLMINYASVRGILRYFKGKQTVNWEKSKRAS